MTGNNAEQIIERFGGIRPMASKMNVPVTTVQGWKKRNFIPIARIPEIQQAAEQNNIDISDLVSGLSDTANMQDPQIEQIHRPYEHIGSYKSQIPREATETSEQKTQNTSYVFNDMLDKRLAEMERKIVAKSIITNLCLLAAAIAAALILFWPYHQIPEQNQSDIAILKRDISALKAEQGFLSELKQDVLKIKESAQAAYDEAKTASSEVLSGNNSALEQRIAKLEGYMGETGTSIFGGLLAKYQEMTASPEGQAQLKSAVQDLNASLQNTPGDTTESELQTARENSPAVSNAFEGVPPADLKAAALLLGMTQFRSSLGRDNQPFKNDLELLVKLSGENDPALKEALLRLAPYAEQGILTPQGLTTEFKMLTGDIVVASLKGEDVSVKDRAKARLNEVFKVEKNGELITGTPAQATLSKTENYLNEGNLEAAITEMQKLQGSAAITASPWINKAQATLLAQKFKMTLSHAINTKASGNITAGGALVPGALIQNKETGVNILQPGLPSQNNLYKSD